MKAAHYITIAVATILIALLYWGGNTIPPKKKHDHGPAMQGGMAQAPNTMKPASLDSLITASNRLLPKTAADTVKTIENELAAIGDSSRMAAVFIRLAGVYERNGINALAAFYTGKAGKLEKSAKTLTFAGQLFLGFAESEASPSVRQWEAEQAMALLEQSEALDANNEDTKLALATAYIEMSGEPMKGVGILRGIVAEKPDDVPANMLLGRMSIQSGQFDKAVGRFETVLKQQPGNSEAMYFLAQAYEGTGDKNKAIGMLEKCKEIVNKPEFSKEIDRKINSLK